MNARRLVPMVLIGVALGIVLVAVRADEPAAAPRLTDKQRAELEKSLTAALNDRVAAAERGLEATQAAFDAQTITLDQLTDAMLTLNKAELAVANTRERRIEILKHNVDLHRALEDRVERLYKLGVRGGEVVEHARAKTARLTAEIDLLREQLKDDS